LEKVKNDFGKNENRFWKKLKMILENMKNDFGKSQK